jgi:beta-galactosidase/beta-glucuronidase
LKPDTANELIIALDNTKGLAQHLGYTELQGHATGLFRPVPLHVSEGPGRIADLYVKPGEDLKEVVWQAQLEVPGGNELSPASGLLWEVCDTAGQALARGEVAVPGFTGQRQVTWRQRIPSIRPWSDRQPNLYRTKIQWRVGGKSWDKREQRFGLRRWSREGRKLFLNGQPIYPTFRTSSLHFI